jgi:peptide/nickel transport system permease protein
MTRQLLRRPLACAAIAWLAIVLIGSIGASLFAPYGSNEQDLAQALTGPSSAHLLGTDQLGRDVLSRLLYGGVPSLEGAAIAVVAWLVLGLVFGLLAGYLGGWVDLVTTRAVDVAVSIPVLIVLLVVLGVFGNNQTAAMLTFGVLTSAGLVRIVRASTLVVREDLYVAAAQVSGLNAFQVITRHVLPRVMPIIIAQAALFAGIALVIQAGLAFLGFGPQPPDPSWGGMINDAAQVINRQSWLLVPTGVVIALTVVAFGILGDAIREISTARWSVSKLTPRRRSGRPSDGARVLADDDVEIPATSDALLSVRNLSIELSTPEGPVTVVQRVSFDVRAGEAFGVVGESGCGKTMTAMGILGLLPAQGRITEGQILFDGRDLAANDGRELQRVRGREIGFISQEPMTSLDPTFSVRSQLAEAVRRHRGVSRGQARAIVLELLAAVGLPDPAAVAKRYPHQLSGGMAQRVGIALALAGEPRLLIADEPTTALDVTVQAEILALLHRLQDERGLAVLLVTHDLGVVADLCTEAAVMYAGQVVEHAPFERIYARPLHPYTRALLGAYPHAATAQDAGTSRRPLAAIPGTVPRPSDWPIGCHFQDRCAWVADACRAAPVPLSSPEPDRRCRCVRIDELEPAIDHTDRVREPA